MSTPLFFSAFVTNTSSHILHGVWRRPDARQVDDYSLDDPIADIQTDGARSLLDWVQASVVGRPATVRDVGLLASQASRVTGTPEHIAEQLALWQEAGIDGINVINATLPGSYTEFIEYVMPVLRKRGLAKEAYTPGTLRRKFFGRDTVPATHPAAAYRNVFHRSRNDSPHFGQ